MKRLALIILILCTSAAGAKKLDWQEATIARMESQPSGTQAAVVPIGNVLYGVSSSTSNGFYWIKTEKITYIVQNFSKGAWVNKWLVLTIGGKSKVALDGKNLHIIDDEGKDRTVRIVAKMTNGAAEAGK